MASQSTSFTVGSLSDDDNGDDDVTASSSPLADEVIDDVSRKINGLACDKLNEEDKQMMTTSSTPDLSLTSPTPAVVINIDSLPPPSDDDGDDFIGGNTIPSSSTSPISQVNICMERGGGGDSLLGELVSRGSRRDSGSVNLMLFTSEDDGEGTPQPQSPHGEAAAHDGDVSCSDDDAASGQGSSSGGQQRFPPAFEELLYKLKTRRSVTPLRMMRGGDDEFKPQSQSSAAETTGL